MPQEGDMATKKVPDGLGDAGKQLWKSITGIYELREDELRVLASACGAADMEAEFRRAWVERGRPYMSTGSMGQEVEHPLIGSIDKQAKSKAAFLKQLGLPDAGPLAAGVSPNQQRSAAQSKWAAAHGKGA